MTVQVHFHVPAATEPTSARTAYHLRCPWPTEHLARSKYHDYIKELRKRLGSTLYRGFGSFGSSSWGLDGTLPQFVALALPLFNADTGNLSDIDHLSIEHGCTLPAVASIVRHLGCLSIIGHLPWLVGHESSFRFSSQWSCYVNSWLLISCTTNPQTGRHFLNVGLLCSANPMNKAQVRAGDTLYVRLTNRLTNRGRPPCSPDGPSLGWPLVTVNIDWNASTQNPCLSIRLGDSNSETALPTVLFIPLPLSKLYSVDS